MPSAKKYSTWSEKIKKADIFEQELEILFENGRHKLQSHCGVLFGFIMLFILVAYLIMKLGIMLNY